MISLHNRKGLVTLCWNSRRAYHNSRKIAATAAGGGDDGHANTSFLWFCLTGKWNKYTFGSYDLAKGVSVTRDEFNNIHSVATVQEIEGIQS